MESMDLQVWRFSSGRESTLGVLYEIIDGKGDFLCFTLEDEYRTEKKYGETRIPAGTYPIELRTFGGHHARYSRKFPDIHKGMLWVRHVPNFKDILIHIGNRDDDTAGCLLVGNSVEENFVSEGFIGSSALAYKRIYLPIATALEMGRGVTIEYVDFA
ncbi:MAG: hypothetical protein GY749_38140 [Desulfobacteraceae bacterium]|nr:hypothetical protein [Desulfobacteraceae bacterium]